MGAGVRKFFMTVLAGVVGATPTMQSAAVMALARLLYEFSAALVSTVPSFFPRCSRSWRVATARL